MLINLLRDHKPDRLAVAFDLPEPTFRHKKYDDYKAGRTAAPDILRQQLGLVRELVDALAVPVLELSGFEADDIIATLATRAKEAGDDVIVVTGDRDAYQLVEDPHVKVLYNKRGVSDYAFYDEAGIFERTGVRPKDYVHYAALRGDKSDNLEGVLGVGEKTAAKLINKYGDIEGIYAHIDEQTPKLRENLATYRENVDRNLEMMPLVLDVPIEAKIDDLQIGGIDAEEVRRLFDFLEFRALYDRLTGVLDFDSGAAMGDVEVIEAEVTVPDTVVEAVSALHALPLVGPVGVTGHLIAQANLFAGSLCEAMLNVMDCWHNANLFDSQLDQAIRYWARTDPQLQRHLDIADEQRFEAIKSMFMRHGLGAAQAEVRAMTVLYTQVGYISMAIKEPSVVRLSRIAQYCEVFTGQQPSQVEMQRFYSRHT